MSGCVAGHAIAGPPQIWPERFCDAKKKQRAVRSLLRWNAIASGNCVAQPFTGCTSGRHYFDIASFDIASFDIVLFDIASFAIESFAIESFAIRPFDM